MITKMNMGKLRAVLIGSLSSAALLALGACSTPEPAAPEVATPVVEAAAPAAPAFSAEGLAALDATMKSAVDTGEVFGLSYVLANGEGEVARNYFGVKSLTTQDPIAEDTIYRIYSMSKPITGVAMMILWEEGKWQLDDPVTDYVPEFAGLQVLDGTNEDGTPKLVNVDRPPTMRELMSHTAGFAYGLGGTDAANQAFRDEDILRSPDFETLISKVSAVPLLFQPGTDWSYSVAVDIQGYIVEKLSGQKFSEFLQERVFTPLEMTDTGFYVPEDQYGRLSDVFTYYEPVGKLVPVDRPAVAFRKDTVAFESGGGGLVATLDDYAHFCRMLLDGGSYNGVQLLKPETIELMATDVLPEGVRIWSAGNSDTRSGMGQGFGLDFGVVVDPALAGSGQGQGSFYWGGAAGTWFWIDPVNDIFFIGMIQRFSGNPASTFDPRMESRNSVYAALED